LDRSQSSIGRQLQKAATEIANAPKLPRRPRRPVWHPETVPAGRVTRPLTVLPQVVAYYLDEAFLHGGGLLIAAVAHAPVLLKRMDSRFYHGHWQEAGTVSPDTIPYAELVPVTRALTRQQPKAQVFTFNSYASGDFWREWYPYLVACTWLSAQAPRPQLTIYLDSRYPMMHDKELAAVQAFLRDFLKGTGRRLQLLPVPAARSLGVQAAGVAASAAKRLDPRFYGQARLAVHPAEAVLADKEVKRFRLAYAAWVRAKR
jgi:hypothetical protein